MSKTPLKDRWKAGETTIGGWCFLGGATVAEAVGAVGFDYVGIDMQHGTIPYGEMVNMVRAIDLGPSAPVVRAPWNDPSILGRILDAGAMGVIVPMINSAGDARRAVDACRYAPDGSRSFGPVRVGLREGPDYLKRANEEIAVLPMIETVEALEALDDILAVDGLDGVYVGIFDLSLAMGLPPGNNDGEPAFDAALQKILAGCEKAGVVAACHSTPDAAALRVEQGFQMVTASADMTAIRGAMAGHLEAARAQKRK